MAAMTRIAEIWRDSLDRTRRAPITDGDFRIFAIDAAAKQEFYAGSDSESHRLLALRVRRDPPRVELNSESITCFSRVRGDGSWLLVLRLEQAQLAVVFERLCEDLVDGAKATDDEQSLLRFIVQRIHLWKRLFSRLGNGFLPEREIKGLVGELLFLEGLLLEQTHSRVEVVTAWEGPMDLDQDFRFVDRTIEIKTIGPAATEVTIASLDQLDAPPPFDLVVLTVRQSGAALTSMSVTLNSLIRRVRSALEAEPEAVALFRDRLLSAGYVEDPYYDAFWFTPNNRSTYPVGVNFPRLTAATVPAGVADATYQISLDELEKLSARQGPADG
jgi:hypothetical protein